MSTELRDRWRDLDAADRAAWVRRLLDLPAGETLTGARIAAAFPAHMRVRTLEVRPDDGSTLRLWKADAVADGGVQAGVVSAVSATDALGLLYVLVSAEG